MTPTVSRLLRWAAVIGVGIALTLAVWQDPVLAYGPGRLGPGPPPTALTASIGVLGGVALALSGWRRPSRVSRRPVPSRPVSVSRPPGRRRSRR